jgi:hypothetical protein
MPMIGMGGSKACKELSRLTVIAGAVSLFLFGAEPLQMFSLAIFLGCGGGRSLRCSSAHAFGSLWRTPALNSQAGVCSLASGEADAQSTGRLELGRFLLWEQA